MNLDLLNHYAAQFARRLPEDSDLQSHMQDHRRRVERAQAWLNPAQIAQLSDVQLRELFFDSDAFGFWGNKDWEFNNRLQKVGLAGMQQALAEVVRRGERGLTTEDLHALWDLRGLGALLTTEMLCYRFPERYWTYNQNVILYALRTLGEDIKARMPHGQKSDVYLYFAIQPYLVQVLEALRAAGAAADDYVMADIFLWWVKQTAVERPDLGLVDHEQLQQALQSFDAQQRGQLKWQDWEARGVERYGIEWQGQRYPARAIMRIAMKLPRLESGEARALLERSGFEVFSVPPAQKAAWLFQMSAKYEARTARLKAVQPGDEDNWAAVTSFRQMRQGDRVAFWISGKDNGGIYALGELLSDPELRPQAPPDAAAEPAAETPSFENSPWQVRVRYTRRLERPILRPALLEHPLLKSLEVLRFPNATNFRISDLEWEALEELLPDVSELGIKKVIEAPFNLGQALMQSFTRRGLYYTPWQIATFYTALQTKHFVVLSGISGTGKTRLAQHFAALLPQPGLAQEEPAEQIQVTVQPYMRRYNRFIVPKASTRYFVPPAPGQQKEIRLEFGSDFETCIFVHAAYTGTDYLQVMLRGRARDWFLANFAEGDRLVLEPLLDAEGQLTGFHMADATSLIPQSGRRAEETTPNWLFLSVRPDWRDSKALLGYFNPLTESYQWTPFLRFIVQALHSFRSGDGLAWFVILDEMNLARVEYYFADLLSVLESGREADGLTREPVRLSYPEDAEGDLPPRELRLPPNLYFVGTVNMDETTFAFSPKVLDRAFTLEMTEVDFTNYLPASGPAGERLPADWPHQVLSDFTFDGLYEQLEKAALNAYLHEHPSVRTRLQMLNELLRPYELHFGYRTFDEIVAFMVSAQANKLYANLSDDAAFDAAVLMKLLPRFQGPRARLEAPLQAVLAWCLDPDSPAETWVRDALQAGGSSDDLQDSLAQANYRLPHTAQRVRRMLWALHTQGFASFG